MEIITKLSVSLTRDNDTVYARAKQNDIGRGIEVTLVENSTVYQLLDTDEVNVYVAKPDGNVVYNPCTVLDGKAVVELTQQMLAKDGCAKCEIEVKRDGNRISNPAFALIIYPENISDDAILSTNEVGVLEQWYLDQIAAMSPVKYTAQALTDEQKAQARENIGAAAVGESGGSGGSVTVDAALSETSTNPVQNKVVTAELNKKAAKSGYTAGKNVVTDADGNLATEDKPTALKNPSALTIKQGDTEVSYDGSDPLTVEIPSGAVGTPGADGKSAYQYAVDGGYTGTETEFAAKLAAELPDALPNPYALTINGTSYDGSNAVNVTVTGESGGNGWSKVAEFEYNLNDELIVDSFTAENKYLHFTATHGLAVGDYLLIRNPYIIKTSKCGYTTVTDIIDENTVVCDSITNTSDFSGNFIVEKSAGRVLFRYDGLITKPFARMRISGKTIFLLNKNWTYSTYYQNYGADCLKGESDNKITSGNSIVAVKGLPYCGQVAVNSEFYNTKGYVMEEAGIYGVTYTRNYSPIPEKHVFTPQLVFNGLRIIVEEADEWDIP